MDKNEKTILPVQITITTIAFVLILAHFFCPPIHFDTVSLILLFIALIPWLFPLIKTLELPGGFKVEFQDIDIKDLEEEAKEKTSKELEEDPSALDFKFYIDNPATLYWLSNDLMWIQDMTFRSKPPSRVLDGINNSITYIKDLGFEDKSFPLIELTHAKIILQALDGFLPKNEKEKAILENHYKNVRQYVENVKWYFDRILSHQEEDFSKLI